MGTAFGLSLSPRELFFPSLPLQKDRYSVRTYTTSNTEILQPTCPLPDGEDSERWPRRKSSKWEVVKHAVQCWSRTPRKPSVRTMFIRLQHLWELSLDTHKILTINQCKIWFVIFMSRLEKTHVDKNVSLSEEISNRVFRVRISWSQTMSPACAIPKLFCLSFHAMASPIWCHRAVKLHKHGLSVPSPQDRLDCTCLAHGDFSDLRVLVSDKPCLLYSPKYVQYVSFSQNSVSEKKVGKEPGQILYMLHPSPSASRRDLESLTPYTALTPTNPGRGLELQAAIAQTWRCLFAISMDWVAMRKGDWFQLQEWRGDVDVSTEARLPMIRGFLNFAQFGFSVM